MVENVVQELMAMDNEEIQQFEESLREVYSGVIGSIIGKVEQNKEIKPEAYQAAKALVEIHFRVKNALRDEDEDEQKTSLLLNLLSIFSRGGCSKRHLENILDQKFAIWKDISFTFQCFIVRKQVKTSNEALKQILSEHDADERDAA